MHGLRAGHRQVPLHGPRQQRDALPHVAARALAGPLRGKDVVLGTQGVNVGAAEWAWDAMF